MIQIHAQDPLKQIYHEIPPLFTNVSYHGKCAPPKTAKTMLHISPFFPTLLVPDIVLRAK